MIPSLKAPWFFGLSAALAASFNKANKSGHFIPLDQPQLVIDSITFLIDIAKDSVDVSENEDHTLELKPVRYAFHDATWRSDRLNTIKVFGPTYISKNHEVPLQPTLALVRY